MIRYEHAPDLQSQAEKISKLIFPHVKIDSLACLRSRGSSSKNTIARCHALNKVMQLSLGLKKGFYAIEFISERFDKLQEDEKTKVVIHELMHIPKSFGGGFKHHDFVNDKTVNKIYRKYKDFLNPNKLDMHLDEYGI